MIRHRFIKSCGAVFLLACLAQSALAAEDNSPLNNWAVGAVSSDTNGRYCSMKTLYQEGQELVFVRDAKGETSIGIDFKKDILSEGYRYDVNVRIGSLTRKLAAIGATKQVVVMKVGMDKDFFKVFKDKNILSFNLIGKDFDFGLAGASIGLKALDTCADLLKSGRKFKQGSVSSGKKVKAEQQQKDQALRQELEHLKTENKNFIQSSRNDRESIKADILKLQEESRKLAAASESERESIKNEISRLKKENEKLSLAAKTAQEENNKLQEHAQKVVVVAPSAQLLELPESLSPVYLTSSEAVSPQMPVLLQPAPEKLPTPAPAVSAEVLPVATEVPESLVSAPVPEASVAEVLKEPDTLKDFLESVHISDGKTEIKEVGASDPKSYRWVSDNIFGFAQTFPLQAGKSLRDSAEDYLKASAGRCKGSYAQKIGDIVTAGPKKMLEAEIACLDKGHNVAAAVLFVAGQKDIHVIIQEGTTVQMPDVLSQRDKIEEAIVGIHWN